MVGVNPAGRSLLNLPPDALGRDLSEVLPEIGEWLDQAPGEYEHEFLLDHATDTGKKVALRAAAQDSQGLRVIICEEISVNSTGQKPSGGTDRLIRLDNLMSRLSHEVRNPLASILAGLQALERSSSLSPDDQFILGLVIGEARAAIRIIERYSESVRTRTVTVARVPLEEFMRNCVAELNDAARKKKVTLRLNPGSSDAWISADARAMGRALRNLVQKRPGCV